MLTDAYIKSLKIGDKKRHTEVFRVRGFYQRY